MPLFTGYLFLLGEPSQRTEALRGNHIANVLEVPDKLALLHDLRQIHDMLNSGLPVLPEPTHPIGARVRILVGPLRGFVGIVVRRDRTEFFVAEVEFLGRGAKVELRDWEVERV
jgi:transcription antitermination factor NusG